MSEVFDPEKVKSYYQPVGWEPHEVVAKSDYNQLLVLYRNVLNPPIGSTDDCTGARCRYNFTAGKSEYCAKHKDL